MLSRRFSLEAGRAVLVAGPAVAQILRGRLECLGKELYEGERVVVREGKELPLEALSNAELEVKVTRGANCRLIGSGESLGTRIWDSAISNIVSHSESCRDCVITALGPVSTGKSTFLCYVANRLLDKKEKELVIIDADIGQNDLGPPCSLALAKVDRQVTDLRELKPTMFDFVGYFSAGLNPHYVAQRVIGFVSRLKRDRARERLILLNTDGFVEGEGLVTKLWLLKGTGTHLAVFTDNGVASKALQLGLAPNKFIVIARPDINVRSRLIRANRRLLQYLKFLQGARPRRLHLSDTRLAFLGRSCRVIDFEPHARSYLLSLSSNEVLVPAIAMDHMFVALARNDEVQGFGVIKQYRRDGEMVVLTPTSGPVNTIFLSLVRLPRLGAEEALRLAT